MVVGRCLFYSDSRRDVSKPGWPEYDQQIIAGANGRLDDGRLVPFDFDWQLHCRPDHAAIRKGNTGGFDSGFRKFRRYYSRGGIVARFAYAVD